MKQIRLFAAAMTVAATAVAGSAQAAGGKWYAGAAVGQSKWSNIDTSGSTSITDSTTGLKLLGGYRINDMFSVEGGYVDFGKYKQSYTDSSGKGQFDDTASGLVVDGLFYPVRANGFAPFLKLGLIQATVKGSISYASTDGSDSYSGSGSKSGMKVSYGLGLDYAVMPAMDVRVGFDHFNLKTDTSTDIKINLLTVGAQYKF